MVELTKTQRALEIVYLACVDIPVKEGRLYMFLAIDDYSTAVFNLNSALELTDAACIDAIKQFFSREEVQRAAEGVHLVVPFNELLRKSIEKLVAPYSGQVSFSMAGVNRVAGPMIKEVLRGVDYKLTYSDEN
jgi:hypothetical protein